MKPESPDRPAALDAAIAEAEVMILRCTCGQRCWIPNHTFNRGSGLEYGTPYRCPSCGNILGQKNSQSFANALMHALRISRKEQKNPR